MAWTTPKTDWDTDEGIEDEDLNRIEENTDFLNDEIIDLSDEVSTHLRNYINGFVVRANTLGLTAYQIAVSGGLWSDNNGDLTDWSGSAMTKTLSASSWTSGEAGNAKAAGATYSTNAWYWVFALYNPTTDDHDFALDDDIYGANLTPIIAAGYTRTRRICALRTSTLLSSNGIIPVYYRSNERLIRYAGAAAARNVAVAVPATTATIINLNDTGANRLIPYDLAHVVSDGGIVELQVSTAVFAGNVTLWPQDIFGTTYYAGIGQTYDFVAPDYFTFRLPINQSFYVYAANAITLTFMMLTMTYDTDAI